MKKILIPAFCFGIISLGISQESDSVVANWKLKGTYALNGTQSSFVNWNAGGRNNVSVLGSIECSAKYIKNRIKWDNDLGLALGGLQYFGNSSERDLQKTDDKIDFSTNFGFRLKKQWYVSVIGAFKTQFLDGYSYPNDSVRVSTFMAPGYGTFAIGMDYSPNDEFSAFISPASAKMTFVQDQLLANAGSFGVKGAEFDAIGNVLTPGAKFRSEFGAYIKLKYERVLAENIELKTKLELFSNYLDHPENIDVNAEVIFNFRVNNWFSATLNWNLLYDNDIDILDANGGYGPRTQFKSVLGIGVSYTMRNFIEE